MGIQSVEDDGDEVLTEHSCGDNDVGQESTEDGIKNLSGLARQWGGLMLNG